MRTMTIGLDCDEVLFDCVDYALKYALSVVQQKPFRKEDITDYAMTSVPIELRTKIYEAFNTPSFYRFQPVFEGAIDMVNTLHLKGHDIVFSSAVPAACMSERGKRIKEMFPFIPDENIMLGCRKDLLAFDVLLDDCPKNIRTSASKYPILFTQPWNVQDTDLMRTSTYPHFIELVEKLSTQ